MPKLWRKFLATVALYLACPCQASDTVTSQQRTINVHVVPHSHMDAGWLLTYEGYYSAKVSRILQNVVTSLKNSHERTYTLGDISFFKHFYDKLTAEKKDEVKALIANG